jgi:uncharacterized protein YabN with tetrapyrrole methylase and pyrophosphatase domain
MTGEIQLRLYLIGLGVKIPDHTTMEATRAMSNCTRIYSIVQEPSSLWLPSKTPHAIEVVNALSMYTEGALRTQNYDRVASVIFQALKETSTVGYVTYGNPLAYDSVAQNLVWRAQQTGVGFKIIPGISSIDTLVCDLGLDMAPGIQVYEASWLVGAQIRLTVSIAAILLQIGTFGSLRTHYRTRRPAESLADLVSYLGSFYPPSHKVFLVQSSNRDKQSARIRQVSLEDLCNVMVEDFLGASMYIPSLGTSRLDQEIISRMERS